MELRGKITVDPYHAEGSSSPSFDFSNQQLSLYTADGKTQLTSIEFGVVKRGFSAELPIALKFGNTVSDYCLENIDVYARSLGNSKILGADVCAKNLVSLKSENASASIGEGSFFRISRLRSGELLPLTIIVTSLPDDTLGSAQFELVFDPDYDGMILGNGGVLGEAFYGYCDNLHHYNEQENLRTIIHYTIVR